MKRIIWIVIIIAALAGCNEKRHPLLKEAGRDDKTDLLFNFQASLLGVEFGGAFRGFVELGFGEQGIALAGLRYKF